MIVRGFVTFQAGTASLPSYLKVLTIFCIFAFSNGFGEEIERKAVLFFNSDKIELRIADVYLKEQKIIRQVFSETEKIPFNEDLWSDPRKSLFSKKTQDLTLNIVEKMMKKADTFKPQAKHGFAGKSFRESKNANDLVKRIYDETGLKVLILSEEQEGVVEFLAAVNIMQLNPVKTITWNIGWDFIRLTAQCDENYFVYVKNIWPELSGHVSNTVGSERKEKKEKGKFHLNPLSEEDLNKEIVFFKNSIKDIPTCIQQKGANPDTVVLKFGTRFNMLKPNSKDYTIEKIQEAFQQRIGRWTDIAYKEDTQTYPVASINNLYGMALTNLIVIYGVMEALGIQRLKVMNAEPDTILGCLLYSPIWK